MARLWYDAAGKILRLCRTDAEESFHGPPAGFVGSVAFDESTNTAAVADLGANWQSHDCPAGVLRKNSVPVTINPDGQVKQDRDTYSQNVATALTRLQQIKSQADGGMTNAQRDLAIGDLAVILGRLVRKANQVFQKVGN